MLEMASTNQASFFKNSGTQVITLVIATEV